MSITKRAKMVVAGLALTGAVVATGSAFTAGGITNNAGATAFVGGSVDQSIVGATLTSVVYDVDEAANEIDSVTLTFSGNATDDMTPTITFTGDQAGAYTCDPIAADGHVSVCTATIPASTSVTSLDINVTPA